MIERRLSQARLELQNLSRYRYALINDDLDAAASEMRGIVLTERGEGAGEEAMLAQGCLTSKRSEHLLSVLGSFAIEMAAV